MKLNLINKLPFILVPLVFILSIGKSHSQNSNTPSLQMGKVSQMSDQQIIQVWQQSQKTGISESDAIKLLVKKGMSPSEVNNFKKRLVQLQAASKSKFSTQNILKDTSDFLKDSSWVFEIPQIKRKSNFYGYDFFTNPNISFEPNLRITIPKNYILGPDDVLSINYTGLNEASVQVKLDPEGSIQLPYAGIISLNGLTVEQASQKIKTKMTVAYPALTSGKTQLFLTVSNFKTIRITVIGEADRAGNYLVSSLASFFNVLYLTGGPSENGSLRKIELIRNNKVMETIDFYSFLQKGILGTEIKLQDQDIIRYPLYNKRASLSGAVKRPFIYELLDKETLTELFQFGGGIDETAVKDVAKIVQMGEKEMKMRDVAVVDFNNFIPRNGDSVFFDKILPRFANRVILTGAVFRPGNYELTEKLSLSGLIKKADGLKEDAYLNRGLIKRRKSDAERELVSFNTKEILNGKQADILLVKEDSIFILSKDSLQDVLTISVGGNVRLPGTFQYREGLSLEDAILIAGGFTNDAAFHKVEISRLEKNSSDTLANKLIDLIKIDMDTSIHNKKTLLQPLDIIFVPRLLNYRNLGTIKIRGEVLYAGDYSLEKRNETIHELLKRSGGISPFASIEDVQVFRKGLRVGTNLLSEESNEKNKFLLQPDDSIFIPKKVPFVEVQGAVFNQQIVSFESTKLMSYISAVGGVMDKGNLNKAYIQYSNGISRKTNHFLFFRIYPKVLPGSKIIVPEKIETQKRGISLIEVSAALGALTALVSIVNLLNK